MSETKKELNTLAQGMFVREHTFKNGTKVKNVSINVADFSEFLRDNMQIDDKGRYWVNLRFIPNANVGENKLSHTPILTDYVRKPKNPSELLEKLANATIIEEEADEKIAEKEQAIVEADKQESDLPF
jgi:hypothetical protein